MNTKNIKLFVVGICLIFGINSVFAAAPKRFTTRNYTPYQSNAKVINSWSPFPTPAGSESSPSEKSVPWVGLKLLCGFSATECTAEIWMKTDTDSPVFVGDGTMDLSTGDITPKELTNNGFTLTTPGPGIIEIREAK